MKIEADFNQGQLKVDSYTAGSITVAGTPYATNIIITPETVIEGRLPDKTHSLAEAHITTILDHNPEVVIFGSGRTLTFPADELCEMLYLRQIGFEIMDTGAACRAFNFLAGEGRQVVAALFQINQG